MFFGHGSNAHAALKSYKQSTFGLFVAVEGLLGALVNWLSQYLGLTGSFSLA